MTITGLIDASLLPRIIFLTPCILCFTFPGFQVWDTCFECHRFINFFFFKSLRTKFLANVGRIVFSVLLEFDGFNIRSRRSGVGYRDWSQRSFE